MATAAKKSTTPRKAAARKATRSKPAASAEKSTPPAPTTSEEFGAPLDAAELTVSPRVLEANAQHAEWARVGMTGDVIPSDEDDDEGDSDG